ncbi:AAA ATPase domain/Origin recognition complex (ORC) subunit 5 C-terminus [Novymonas esmeraldas]|uniref:AAA ATPase domain/Origin recognition complex (ORC) subunit 5 C-terminus n=1 Tax=Novymonas esmeraldas TaxID=1808958 RepID=A0AAW0F6P5_9TRYP
MADLRDELDASVLFGSGYVCVAGPPSSGKTTLVLEYLVARERQALLRARANADSEAAVFCLEYASARSASHELLRCLVHRLLPSARRRRLSRECTPLEFGASLVEWLESHPERSELHLVVDDADVLEHSPEEMNLWLSHCLRAPAAQSRKVVLWLISELPLRLSNCFRYHFIARPEARSIVRWLQRQYTEEQRHVADLDNDGGDAESAADGAGATVVSAADVHRVVVDAFAYYTAHQPMCSSVVSRDVRQLIQRVYQILPPLLLDAAAAQGPDGGAEVGGLAGGLSRLNARHFAAAWGQHRREGGGGEGGASGAAATSGSDGALDSSSAPGPLVVALKRIGYSAVLLATAAFYCGAVPKRKQQQVFGRMGGEERKVPAYEAKGQSHKAAVLSSSAHVLTVRRLAFLYDAMLRMCTPHIDPLEFATADVAVQHVQTFVAWGLLTPVAAQRHRSYHCWIPVSTALQLARELSLSLFDLIPD